MDNPRPAKASAVKEVRSRLDRADAVIVTEYRGLKVKDLAALRRSLAPLGGEYRIYKNTLARIAAGDRGHDGFEDLLIGPTALTFVQGDAAAVTKLLRDFARANPMLVIKGGLLGKSVLGPSATVALADLPSREVLLARLAGALAAPMQIMAGLLAAVPRNFAYGLSALRDKLAAEEPQAEAAQAEPEAEAAQAEPEAAEAEPEAAEAEPEAAEAQPEAAEAQAEPEEAQAAPEEAQPAPEPAEAVAAEPEAQAEPEEAEAVAAQPEAVEAEAAQSEEAEPEATEPGAAPVEAAPPEAAEAVAAQPEAVEAEAAQAEETQPKETQPEEIQPEEG